MAGVNKIILIGHLGKDPDLRHGQQSGKAVCRFSLATTEKYGGEEKTEWHNCVAFNRLAEIADQYLRKGSMVYIEGRIQTRKWQDKDGSDRYTTEILVSNLTMLGGKINETEGRKPQATQPDKDMPKATAQPGDPFNSDNKADPLGNDMPF